MHTWTLDDRIAKALRTVIDPEIGINIVDLGLVYGALELPNGDIDVQMTLTTPVCPLSTYLQAEAEAAIRRAFPEAGAVRVQIVWDPPWDASMMSDRARRELGWQQ